MSCLLPPNHTWGEEKPLQEVAIGMALGPGKKKNEPKSCEEIL